MHSLNICLHQFRTFLQSGTYFVSIGRGSNEWAFEFKGVLGAMCGILCEKGER